MAKRAYSGYMKIEKPNIQGESTEQAHKDWIEIFGYEFECHYGIDELFVGRHIGASIGKPVPGEFKIRKYIDRSSPTLQMTCCKGGRIERIAIELVRALGDQGMCVFYRWVLKHSYISFYEHKWSGHEDTEDVRPVEDVSFLVSEASWEYVVFDMTGSSVGTVSHTFNFLQRKGS